MFGCVNVNKPEGMTSHDVVAALRSVTKIKQIGHTGTLDPFAEGVLPICIGKATRLIEYFDDDKAYIGTVKLGSSTTTYDIEGEVVKTSDKTIDKQDINNVLPNFRGEIEQYPPIYSAIKVKGKKLYEYARNGEEIKIEPRRVNIQKLELLNFNKEEQTAELLIECSKGTYIRSIANDIGEKIGVYGHLIKLQRIKAGKFEIKNSIKLGELKNIEVVEKNLINPIYLLNYPQYQLDIIQTEKILHGQWININNENGKYVLINDNKMIAIGDVKDRFLKPLKVFY